MRLPKTPTALPANVRFRRGKQCIIVHSKHLGQQSAGADNHTGSVRRLSRLPDLSPHAPPMSPSHTRRRGRIYRYYVTREAIADGYDTCAVTSVPAADVEGAVLDHVQKLLAAPELVARTWAAANREAEDEITEREVTVLLADFATVWNELFPRAGADRAAPCRAGRRPGGRARGADRGRRTRQLNR